MSLPGAAGRDRPPVTPAERRVPTQGEARWIPRPPGPLDLAHAPASPPLGVDPASDGPPLMRPLRRSGRRTGRPSTTAAPVGPGTPAGGKCPRRSGPRRPCAWASTGYTAAHGDPVTRLPVPRRRVRWATSCGGSPRGAGAVVLLVAGAVALRAVAAAPGPAVVLPDPGPEPVRSPLASPTVTPASGVVVDVVGAVAAPGVVRLAQGSRVVDAIAAAGGATADAQVSALNLARVLVDGEQIAVPGTRVRTRQQQVPRPRPAGTTSWTSTAADAAALDGLPGIGPVLADRIVAHREDGPFTTVDELADVAGIGPTLLERLRDLVRV